MTTISLSTERAPRLIKIIDASGRQLMAEINLPISEKILLASICLAGHEPMHHDFAEDKAWIKIRGRLPELPDEALLANVLAAAQSLCIFKPLVD